jgi:hypothetical protein
VDVVDLTRAYGVDRQRAWRTGDTETYRAGHVVFGKLADGRWFAERRGYQIHDGGAFVFDATEKGKTLALRLAYRWMSDGQRWLPTPAVYDGEEKPVDGLPWVRRGSVWVLPG